MDNLNFWLMPSHLYISLYESGGPPNKEEINKTKGKEDAMLCNNAILLHHPIVIFFF